MTGFSAPYSVGKIGWNRQMFHAPPGFGMRQPSGALTNPLLLVEEWQKIAALQDVPFSEVNLLRYSNTAQ